MNNVVLIGRLVRDPEIRHIQSSQRAVCSFSLAVDKRLSREKRAEFESSGKPTADFIRIVVWGRQAELCNTYLRKGAKVGIHGSISTSSSTDAQGNRKYYTDVVANQIEFLEKLEAKAPTYQPQNSGFESSAIDEMSFDFDDSNFPLTDDSMQVPF